MMFLNDEWITGNQIYQIDQGHQILFAEGKYGYYGNNTPGGYFQERGNILLYSSYLPILSSPAIIAIKIMGESLRFIIASLLSLVIIVLGLYIRSNHSDRISWFISTFLISSSIFVFFLNLWYYQPVPLAIHTSPYEILGVWVYHLIVFTLLGISISSLCRIIFPDKQIFQTAVISSLTCSSYLFWTMTLKDHIDSVFFIVLILYSVLCSYRTRDFWFFPVSFLLAGLLIWVRPELGVFLFGAVIVLFLVFLGGSIQIFRRQKRALLFIIAPLFSILGAVPLLVSNFCITGNPLMLAWQVHPAIEESIGVSLMESEGSIETTIPIIIQTVIGRITPSGCTCFHDLIGILLIPDGMKVPVLSLTPLFILGILLIPYLFFSMKQTFNRDEWRHIFILFIFSASIILAYGSSIQNLELSKGIYPDYRYLSPVYLPCTLIGLIVIRKLFPTEDVWSRILKWSFIVSILGIAISMMVLVGSHRSLDFWNSFHAVNFLFPILIYSGVAVTFFCIILEKKMPYGSVLRDFGMSLLIAGPLLWQVSLLIICQLYPTMFTSYPSLIPVVQGFFEYISG